MFCCRWCFLHGYNRMTWKRGSYKYFTQKVICVCCLKQWPRPYHTIYYKRTPIGRTVVPFACACVKRLKKKNEKSSVSSLLVKRCQSVVGVHVLPCHRRFFLSSRTHAHIHTYVKIVTCTNILQHIHTRAQTFGFLPILNSGEDLIFMCCSRRNTPSSSIRFYCASALYIVIMWKQCLIEVLK